MSMEFHPATVGAVVPGTVEEESSKDVMTVPTAIAMFRTTCWTLTNSPVFSTGTRSTSML